MPHMTIMRGGPGSGKSTLAKKIAAESDADICSADDFFINEAGEYRFDPMWLGRAHGACLQKCVLGIIARRNIVIDNTNSSPDEMLPYLALCQAFGYTCKVIRVLCDRDLAWARQQHGVDLAKFNQLHTSVVQQQVPKDYRNAPWLTIEDVGEAPPARPKPKVFKPYSGARCIYCCGTVVYFESVRYKEHEHDSCYCDDPVVGEPFPGIPRPPTIPGKPTALTTCRTCDGQVALWNGMLMPMHQQTTCTCEDPDPEKPKPACNCGVSLGIRADHEAECAGAYMRRVR